MECHVFNYGNLYQTTTSRNEGAHAAFRSNRIVIPKLAESYLCRPVMAFGRVRTGIRPRTDRHLSVPRSGRFLNMVRPGRVGPTSVKYPRNPGQIQESLKTDRVFITSNMDVTGRVLKL